MVKYTTGVIGVHIAARLDRPGMRRVVKFHGGCGCSGVDLGQDGSRGLENTQNDLLGLGSWVALVPSTSTWCWWVARRRLRSKSEMTEDWGG